MAARTVSRVEAKSDILVVPEEGMKIPAPSLSDVVFTELSE